MTTFTRPLLAASVLIGTVGLLAALGEEKLAERYRGAAGRIVGSALQDMEGWEKLTYLTTEIGPRLSGSSGLERAIEWAHTTMKEEGLENARLQPVKVPHWVRGKESAEVVSPFEKPLGILGLGGSVGTSVEGITAAVVVVSSFDELEALGRERIEGKTVLYAAPWVSYSRNREYRSGGAGCVPRSVEKERRPPLRHRSIISGGNLRVFENLAQTLVAVDAS